MIENIRLNSGWTIPSFGYGTWQTPVEVACDSVESAIRTGFRHIDGAASYNNEKGVGEGIRRCIEEGIVTRDRLFVTSKVWNTERGYDRTLRAFDRTQADLGLVVELAGKYGVTVPQLILRWVMACGIIPLSKSVTPERIEQNFASTGFDISEEDAGTISALGYCGGKCRNPDLVAY